jgi:hypothetical protein
MVSQILSLFVCNDFNGFNLLARFIPLNCHLLSILVSCLCMLYHNVYYIFSCYLPSTKSGLRCLYSCSYIGVVNLTTVQVTRLTL